jgi:hypothetical protein
MKEKKFFTAKDRKVVYRFSDLIPEAQKVIKQINKERKSRGFSELLAGSSFLADALSPVALTFGGDLKVGILAPSTALGLLKRKQTVDKIVGLHEKLADIVAEKGLLAKKSGYAFNYRVKGLMKPEELARWGYLFKIKRNGDLVALKLTKTEKTKYKWFRIGKGKKDFFSMRKWFPGRWRQRFKPKPLKRKVL